jgi:hypothetical protein
VFNQEFRDWYNAGGSSFVPSNAGQSQVAEKVRAQQAAKVTSSVLSNITTLVEARALTGLKSVNVSELQDGQ